VKIFLRTGIFVAIMGYAKERGKLEKLLTKLVGVNIYNEKGLVALNDCHENYSHTVRILKNKEPELFTELYKKELQEVKDAKKTINPEDAIEDRQNKFNAYKDVIVNAIEKTIAKTNETN